MTQKTALVCGAGGFIGYHLVKRYKEEGLRKLYPWIVEQVSSTRRKQ